MAASAERPLRCAVYTRKSSEEGLDQEFNSLDAQREACTAYVMSQRHEGWTLVPEIYDDGGYSGGSMDRPGLQHLLADVEAGRVNVIVVYKVDRLTRSLADFAKMVEILDAAGASFVSITQAFNTTTSMGRLTLNVLLSFAQFEREVTGERIRDKIAASKKKGMWMGGTVPIGYQPVDRKLVIVEEEADLIRMAMRRYVELRSVRLVAYELNRAGLRTRATMQSDGSIRGGVPFGRGGLRHLLKNPLYMGDVVHKGSRHQGVHEPIVSKALFDHVQQVLAEETRDKLHGTRAKRPSLLSGLMRDGYGRAMVPSHAKRRGLHYVYYITHPSHIAVGDPPAWRMPAHDLEQGIINLVACWLGNRSAIAVALADHMGPEAIVGRQDVAGKVAKALRTATLSEQRGILLDWVERIDLADRIMTVTIKVADGCTHVLEARHHKLRRGNDVTLHIAPDTNGADHVRDEPLVAFIADARAARQAVLQSPDRPLDAIASSLGVGEARLKRMIRISYLAPSIVEAIVDGTQPNDLTVARLNTITNLPLAWNAQKALFGIA
ncbi:MAG: recombinase family protein [Sphingomonadaceae bacterium]